MPDNASDRVDEIIKKGEVTEYQLRALEALIAADGMITPEEKDAMKRLLTAIAFGDVKVVG